MDIQLLKPKEVDVLLRYPVGRAQRLAKKGMIPCIVLPDGSIRFNEKIIESIIRQLEQGPHIGPVFAGGAGGIQT